MEWFSIVLLVLMGLALLIVELIFIPGTTVIGLLGVIFIVVGVYFGFEAYGKTVGMYITLGSVTLTAVTLYLGFRSKAWERFSLKSSMDGKVNEGLSDRLVIGQEGLAVSTLKPIGRGEFEGSQYEVSTIGDYIQNGQQIKVIKIDRNKIYVEPIN